LSPEGKFVLANRGNEETFLPQRLLPYQPVRGGLRSCTLSHCASSSHPQVTLRESMVLVFKAADFAGRVVKNERKKS